MNYAKSTGEAKPLLSNKYFLIIMLVSSLVTIILSGAFSFGSKVEVPKANQAFTLQTTTRKVDYKKWTDWVRLPPNESFEIDHDSKHLIVSFWDGRVWNSNETDRRAEWFGKIENNTFKLKGNSGEVKIIVKIKTVDLTPGIVRITPPAQLPVSDEPPLYAGFEGPSFEKLQTGTWSRNVITPPDPLSDYRISVRPPTGCYIWYQGGKPQKVGEYAVREDGVRRGVFRLLGTSPGQVATITVSRR